MPWPWLFALSAALLFASTSAIVLFLIARAPAVEDQDVGMSVDHTARSTKLGPRPRSPRTHAENEAKTRIIARDRAIAELRKIGRSANDVPRTVEAAAQQLVASLSETERDLLRDPADNSLRLGISLKIRQNWGLSNPNSAICFDAVDHYDAYDPDTISGVILDAAQELLSVESR